MSTPDIFSENSLDDDKIKMQDEYVARVSKPIKTQSTLYLLIIALLLGGFFAANFYFMSTLNDGINTNHSEIHEISDELNAIKTEIILSNNLLQIIANNSVNEEVKKAVVPDEK